jgi:putative oxidoreductase
MIHYLWSMSDPVVAQDQMAHFMKNVSLLRSVLLVFYFGSGPLSLDGRSRSRSEERKQRSVA